jgi:hypothetical protein
MLWPQTNLLPPFLTNARQNSTLDLTLEVKHHANGDARLGLATVVEACQFVGKSWLTAKSES